MRESESHASLNNVERIKSPNAGAFVEEVVAKQRPVILTDLFAGQRIFELSEPGLAAIHLKDIQLRAIRVTENFLLPTKSHTCSFEQYRQWITDNPNCCLWCYQPLPESLRALFTPPPYVDPRTDDLSALFYISTSQLRLSLHFDVDFKQNLMTQVLGRKRYILIPPRFSKRLNPYFNYSQIALANYSEPEKLAFVKYNDGFDCIVDPGETLFIPKSWWHYVEYLSFSITVSLRYAKSPFSQVFTLLPRCYLLQNIGNSLIDERRGAVIREDCYKSLIESYYRNSSSVSALHQRFYKTKEDIYAEVCLDSLQGKYVCDALNLERKRLKARKSLWALFVVRISMKATNPTRRFRSGNSRRFATYREKPTIRANGCRTARSWEIGNHSTGSRRWKQLNA